MQNIFLIVTFERVNNEPEFDYGLGCIRTPGCKLSFEEADNIVRNNVGDLYETVYDYACIEEIEPHIYPTVSNRWVYKFNRNNRAYELIETPDRINFIRCPIGGIG